MALNIIINADTDTTFYDSVRRLLGGVDEEVLSDDDILDPAFFDMAEMEIMAIAPCLDSTDVNPIDLSRARLAMIHLIASKLCPTVKGKVEYEVKTIDVTWKRSPVKYDVLQEDLLAAADGILNGISCYESGEGLNIFAIAPSQRAVKEKYE